MFIKLQDINPYKGNELKSTKSYYQMRRWSWNPRIMKNRFQKTGFLKNTEKLTVGLKPD